MKANKFANKSFADKFNLVQKEALIYMDKVLKKKKEIIFLTEDLEDEDENINEEVLYGLPQVTVYNKDGFSMNDYAVEKISLNESGYIDLEIIGIGNNMGNKESITIADITNESCIYLADQVSFA